MRTKVVKVDEYNPREDLLRPCAEALREGALVAFPTETVYGLGANALLPHAVSKIFRAKGRPQDNPLIVHVSRLESVAPLVREIPPLASRLMEMFWPGPLTLVFPKSALVPPEVTAGLSTVAIRMPDHPVAHSLIDLAGVPVAAPSANISGGPSPTTFEATLADLDGLVDFIVRGGSTGIGVESTVLDVGGPVPTVLRPGGLPVEDLRRVLGRVEVVPQTMSSPKALSVPPVSPGMKYRHYAPKAEIRLAAGSPFQQKNAVVLHALKSIISGKRVAVLASSENVPYYQKLLMAYPGSFYVLELGPRSDLAPVAARLFSSLRHADSLGADLVLAESFPDSGLGLAVRDRLERASGGAVLPQCEDASLNVLMVCTGNTCRSPMAEAILRRKWEMVSAEKGICGGLKVWSRGTAAIPGVPASPEAVSAMAREGIDLTSHRSGQVSGEDLEKADLVIVMTRGHKNMLLHEFAEYAFRVRTLSEVSEGAVEGDLDDPYGRKQEAYDRTAKDLDRGLLVLATRLADLLSTD